MSQPPTRRRPVGHSGKAKGCDFEAAGLLDPGSKFFRLQGSPVASWRPFLFDHPPSNGLECARRALGGLVDFGGGGLRGLQRLGFALRTPPRGRLFRDYIFRAQYRSGLGPFRSFSGCRKSPSRNSVRAAKLGDCLIVPVVHGLSSKSVVDWGRFEGVERHLQLGRGEKGRSL